jgi:hypothetical protein
LQSYRFNFDHVSGKTNELPNALSRHSNEETFQIEERFME